MQDVALTLTYLPLPPPPTPSLLLGIQQPRCHHGFQRVCKQLRAGNREQASGCTPASGAPAMPGFAGGCWKQSLSVFFMGLPCPPPFSSALSCLWLRRLNGIRRSCLFLLPPPAHLGSICSRISVPTAARVGCALAALAWRTMSGTQQTSNNCCGRKPGREDGRETRAWNLALPSLNLTGVTV